MDLLISDGIRSSVLASQMSIGSHYDSVDYDAMGQGYSLKKFDAEILAIGNSTIHGAEVLARRCLLPLSVVSSRLPLYRSF